MNAKHLIGLKNFLLEGFGSSTVNLQIAWQNSKSVSANDMQNLCPQNKHQTCVCSNYIL